MSRSRGCLNPADKQKIVKNYMYLLENFDPVDGTLDYLFSACVFDIHDKDKVKNGGENTAKARADRFFEILFQAGEKAYSNFLEALRECGNENFIEKLEATDTSEVDTEEPFAWINDLSEDQKKKPPTDAEASRLSAAFGKNWEHVFYQLDLSKSKIEQAQMSNPHSPGVVITNLLIQWRQMNGSKAHFIKLLDAMKNADSTINWDLIKMIAKDRS